MTESRRIDIRTPALRDLLQRILDMPAVQAISIAKAERPEEPVEVGVRRGGLWSWSYGASAFQAATQAAEALRPRKLVEEAP